MSELAHYVERMAKLATPDRPFVLHVHSCGLLKPPIRCRLSHVVTIDCRFDDDPSLIREACERLGWEFIEGQQTFKWFGRWMDDYAAEDAAYKLGIKPEDYGKCTHAIRVPGANYEIGLVTQADGSLLPVWDFFGAGGLRDIRAENGVGGFQQAYAVAKAKRELKKNRKVKSVKEVRGKDGKIELIATT